MPTLLAEPRASPLYLSSLYRQPAFFVSPPASLLYLASPVLPTLEAELGRFLSLSLIHPLDCALRFCSVVSSVENDGVGDLLDTSSLCLLSLLLISDSLLLTLLFSVKIL